MDFKKAVIGSAVVGTGLVGTGYVLSQPSNPVTSTNVVNNCKYSCVSPDRDCSDFSSQGEAQEFFNCCGFTISNDPMKLDSVGDGNGVACESK